MNSPSNDIPASSYTRMIQRDWDDREFVEIMQLNILQMTRFLNEFDLSVKSKLSTLNEKMSKLERAVEYCETCIKMSE